MQSFRKEKKNSKNLTKTFKHKRNFEKSNISKNQKSISSPEFVGITFRKNFKVANSLLSYVFVQRNPILPHGRINMRCL